MSQKVKIEDPAETFVLFVAEKWPQLPHPQARTLGTHLWQGWAFESIGKDGEVNITKDGQERYIREDGVHRP